MSANNIENLFLGNRLLHFQRFVDRQRAKCCRMFTYENLPFPSADFELMLQEQGCVFVYKDGSEFKFCATEPDVADFVRFSSDSVEQGILPILQEHALLDGQHVLTVWRALINMRTNFIIEAKDENSKQSADIFADKLQAGELAVMVTDSPLAGLAGVEVHNTQIVSGLADQIVTIGQYITAKYYGELGITVNGDVKRQYVNETEIRSNSGQPLVFDMLECRRFAVEVLNDIFDLDVSVELSDTWDNDVNKIQELEESAGEESAGEESAGEESAIDVKELAEELAEKLDIEKVDSDD